MLKLHIPEKFYRYRVDFQTSYLLHLDRAELNDKEIITLAHDEIGEKYEVQAQTADPMHAALIFGARCQAIMFPDRPTISPVWAETGEIFPAAPAAMSAHTRMHGSKHAAKVFAQAINHGWFVHTDKLQWLERRTPMMSHGAPWYADAAPERRQDLALALRDTVTQGKDPAAAILNWIADEIDLTERLIATPPATETPAIAEMMTEHYATRLADLRHLARTLPTAFETSQHGAFVKPNFQALRHNHWQAYDLTDGRAPNAIFNEVRNFSLRPYEPAY